MNFSNICRTCLSDKELNPLFLNPKDHVQYATAVYIALGIKVHPHDGLPQKMCKPCVDHLNNCLRFRTKCKEVEQKLLSVKKPGPTRSRVKKKAKNVENVNYRINQNSVQMKSNGVTYIMTTEPVEKNNQNPTQGVARIENKILRNQRLPVRRITRSVSMTNQRISSGNSRGVDDLIKQGSAPPSEYTEYDWLEDDIEIDDKWPLQQRVIKTDNDDEKNDESNQVIQAPQPMNENESQNEMKNPDSESIDQHHASAEDPESNEKMNYGDEDYDDDDQENADENLYVYSDEYDNDDEKRIKQENVEVEMPQVPSCLYSVHADGEGATCGLCAVDFPSGDVQLHFTQFHSETDDEEEETQGNCEEYFNKTASPAKIVQRPAQAASGTIKILKCGYCKTEFDNREILIKHVTSCRRKMNNAPNPQIPISKPESESKPPETIECGTVECGECHEVVLSNKLWQHRILYHVNSVVCEHCGKNFKSKHRLIAHKRSKHGYEKLKCPLCDLEFASQVSLRNHERRHRGEKPYVCDICGSKFHASYLLVQHKKFHRIARTFKCDQCPASFKTNLGLYNHKRGRHSTLLVKCELCSRTYSCRHYAMKHLRYMHQFKGGGRPPLEIFQLDPPTGENSPLEGQSLAEEEADREIDESEMVDDSEADYDGDMGDVDGEN